MSMSNEPIENNAMALQTMMDLELQPLAFEDEKSITNYTKLSLSNLSSLGVSFAPVVSALQNAAHGAGAASGLYQVTIPQGTHLAQFKNGTGFLGTVLNSNNQIAGQATLTPADIEFDPMMILIAAALANINKKLDAIQELQQEMMDFLVQKEKAELRGSLIFLSDVLKDYKLNWNNDMYKNSNHVKVLDIRQAAEQKILFYRDQISSKLKKESFIHSDKDAEKQIAAIQSAFKEYQLALYMHAFSSFLDVMLVGNFASDYLNGVKKRIEEYSWQYRELYTKCYDQLEDYYGSSVQSILLKGLKKASKATGEAIAKIPVLSKGTVDEAMIDAGGKLDRIGTKRNVQHMQKLVDYQSSFVSPFVEKIETVERFYNSPIRLVFNKDTLYLDVEEEAS